MINRQMGQIVRNQVALTLPRTASIQDACRCMRERQVGAVLVTDSKGRLIGIFTGRDAVLAMSLAREPAETQLKDVMTKNPVTLSPGRTAIDALRLMQDGGFRHVPVVETDGRVIGVVSRGDFRGLEHDRLDEPPRHRAPVDPHRRPARRLRQRPRRSPQNHRRAHVAWGLVPRGCWPATLL